LALNNLNNSQYTTNFGLAHGTKSKQIKALRALNYSLLVKCQIADSKYCSLL